MATRKDIREDIRGQFGGYLTVSQIAQYIGIDRRTAKKYILEHELEPTRICGHWRYSVIDLGRCLGR